MYFLCATSALFTHHFTCTKVPHQSTRHNSRSSSLANHLCLQIHQINVEPHTKQRVSALSNDKSTTPSSRNSCFLSTLRYCSYQPHADEASTLTRNRGKPMLAHHCGQANAYSLAGNRTHGAHRFSNISRLNMKPAAQLNICEAVVQYGHRLGKVGNHE